MHIKERGMVNLDLERVEGWPSLVRANLASRIRDGDRMRRRFTVMLKRIMLPAVAKGTGIVQLPTTLRPSLLAEHK